MMLKVIYSLLFVTVIGAFVSPSVSKTSISSITSPKSVNSKRHSNLHLTQKSFSSNLLAPKERISLVCHAKQGVEKSLSKKEEEELTEENLKEANLTRSYIVLGVLLITFASNQWSRQALYYLCDFSSNADPFKHINAGVGFNKEQYASLASFGFTIVFAFVSLFAGSVSDRFDRNVVTALSCGIWSATTAVQGLATGYSDLLPLRAIIGASQAFFNPAAYTLIAEIFPKKMIGSVNGIFSSGIYVGGGLASLSIILDGNIGWRNTLFVVGGLGMVVSAMCYFLVSEPRALGRGGVENSKIIDSVIDVTTTISTPVVEVEEEKKEGKSGFEAVQFAASSLLEVLKSNEAKLLFSAAILRFCAGFSIAIWKAPFVFAKFPENASSFAGSNAAIVALGGLISSLLGGVISDYLANPPAQADGTPNRPRARCWVPAIGSLLAAPLWAAFILADDPAVAAACLLGEYLTAECWFGPTLATLFGVVPKDKRGTAQGFFSVLTAAGNIAPVAVGAFAGGQLGSYNLGNVLICAVSGAYLLSSVLFLLVALSDDKKIGEEWDRVNSKAA